MSFRLLLWEMFKIITRFFTKHRKLQESEETTEDIKLTKVVWRNCGALQQKSMPKAQRNSHPGIVHFGTGAPRTLDAAAATRAKTSVFCDVREGSRDEDLSTTLFSNLLKRLLFFFFLSNCLTTSDIRSTLNSEREMSNLKQKQGTAPATRSGATIAGKLAIMASNETAKSKGLPVKDNIDNLSMGQLISELAKQRASLKEDMAGLI
ncbi:uncharacterized protein LOC124399717 [Silurus meridionalis]|uniref:uncharacterized protein LOC124399717 n=1 Tax=Silurus meridionalis TaxID=175797 RepID=UPI001EEB4116|nr:uncharacterized protein LOC124399717 [Silurus meridionalis]